MHIDPQQFIRFHLQRSFAQVQQKNSSFSMRAFAKKLGISSSALSEVLNGHRNVSHKKALNFAKILNWDPQVLAQLNHCFESDSQFSLLKDFTNKFRSSEELTNTSSQSLFQHWIYITILATLRLSTPPSSPDEMAELLGIPIEFVQPALDKLVDQGLIQIDSNGKLQGLKKTLLTDPTLTNEFFKPRIEQSLVGMQAALNQTSKPESYPWEGYVSTIATTQSRLKEATPIIEDFVRRLSLFLSDTPNKDQVYELGINLFPRSHKNSNRV